MKVNGNSILKAESSQSSNHHAVAINPLRDDAFDRADELKIELITQKFTEIIEILGFDLTNDSLKDTPERVAKMYVNEVFRGLNPKNRPRVKVFKNTFGYHSPLVELDIPFTSFCEHHFVPIQGKANIAYIPKEHIIGLSKIHRLIDFYARRPQVQERLTMQIIHELKSTLDTEDVGVVLRANHSCISCRGVDDVGSSTLTSVFLGQMKKDPSLMSVLLGTHCS